MKYEGDLEITKSNVVKYKDLTEVTGDLYISSEAKLEALKSVGGDLYINSEAKLEALKSVGGYLSINSEAIKNFPNNVKIKCLRKICGNIGRVKFDLIDGISCAVLSTRSKDNLTIKRCRRSVFKNGGLVGYIFFVASNENNNAHGETMKEAIEELHFKEASRDISQYKNMNLDTKKTPKEWALVYRAITGACKLGTEMFMGDKKLKKKYTLKEIIEETSNAYGGERFREVVSE